MPWIKPLDLSPWLLRKAKGTACHHKRPMLVDFFLNSSEERIYSSYNCMIMLDQIIM
jgi:hypothetical protein